VLSGILQAINVMSARTGLIGVVAPLALLECIAILGTASAWFSGAARLPFVAGSRSLPASDHWSRASPLPHALRQSHSLCRPLRRCSSPPVFSASRWAKPTSPCSTWPSFCSSCLPLTCSWRYSSTPGVRTLNSRRTRPISPPTRSPAWASTLIGLVVAFIPSRQVNSVWIFRRQTDRRMRDRIWLSLVLLSAGAEQSA